MSRVWEFFLIMCQLSQNQGTNWSPWKIGAYFAEQLFKHKR